MIEIIPVKDINAEIEIPGSKYIANRILIIASLAKGTSIIKNLPDNEDINAAISALKKFGIKIVKKKNAVFVNGTKTLKVPKQVNVNESGTLLRFLTAFSSLADGEVSIIGSKRVMERPIGDLIKGLTDLGVKCECKGNLPPALISGGLIGGKTTIKGDVSSQFISSLLLIAPYAKNDVEIFLKSNAVSKVYIDMTIDLMEKFGVLVKRYGYKKFFVKSGQVYSAKKFFIPADWSSANYFFAAAAIKAGRIRIKNLDFNSRESKFLSILEKMGCEIKESDSFIEVKGEKNLKGIDVDMNDLPDNVQTLSAIAPFAEGKTIMRNISHLHFKESDRIKDTAKELLKLNIKVNPENNQLKIEKSNVQGNVIETHNDHRIAMSLALIGLRVKGIKINNPECVNKSFPQFWDKLKVLGAKIIKW